jgi:chaperone protein DnaJ
MILLLVVIFSSIFVAVGSKLLFCIDGVMIFLFGCLMGFSAVYHFPNVFSEDYTMIIALFFGGIFVLLYNVLVRFLYSKSAVFLFVWNYLMSIFGILALYSFIIGLLGKKNKDFFPLILKNPTANMILFGILIAIASAVICGQRIYALLESDMDLNFDLEFKKQKKKQKKVKESCKGTDKDTETEDEFEKVAQEFVDDFEHYCSILNIDNYREVTQEEINEHYHQLAKKYHPDVNTDKVAKDLFKEINNAKDFLTDDNIDIYLNILDIQNNPI